jgi:hypothetical protein
VRSHLAVEYSLPLELLNLLHSHSWLYAVIACNPIEALSILLIEQENSATAPPTIYLGIEQASQLPTQFLQELDSVIIALAEDSHLARNALALLPDAELVNPQSSWNDIWIQLIEQEQPTHKQNNQHYKQRIQDIELD